MFEIEMKFKAEPTADLRTRLATLGGVFEGVQLHCDRYYNHPARDFAQTSEALRIRRVDGVPMITYKGPRQWLVPTLGQPALSGREANPQEGAGAVFAGQDTGEGAGEGAGDGVKFRRELEWVLSPGDPEGELMEQLLVALGFRFVAQVQKRREVYSLDYGGLQLSVAFDRVEDLGDYVEVESLLPSGAEDRVRGAEVVARFAKELGLERGERRSYLRLVLERGGGGVRGANS